uniref:Uncharacterized protein n=1 Tax=Romanomermis culicivorax TaxID=13658 RepID=A0A915HJR5_ROMCU
MINGMPAIVASIRLLKPPWVIKPFTLTLAVSTHGKYSNGTTLDANASNLHKCFGFTSKIVIMLRAKSESKKAAPRGEV